ncbi:MAG: hypothetical protein HZB19_00620 [Chloroflexi bacterium]|nr:hypothetical protein [Chloroflexota bacterium]
MTTNASFWRAIGELASAQHIVIDRPKGQPYPTAAALTCGLAHSMKKKILTGILCAFDTLKLDAEIKTLLGCSKEDVYLINTFYGDEMKILYIPTEPQ